MKRDDVEEGALDGGEALQRDSVSKEYWLFGYGEIDMLFSRKTFTKNR